MRSIEEDKAALPLCPMLEDGRLFRMACYHRPSHEVQPWNDETHYWVYTDGSLKNPNCHLLADAAWAIVFSKALDEGDLGEVVADAKRRKVPIETFTTLKTGKLKRTHSM